MNYKRMRTLAAVLLAGVMTVSSVQGQTAGESVKAAVDRLFTGMKTSDSALIRRCFAGGAILQTIDADKPQPAVRAEDVPGFASVVGKSAPGDLDERIRIDVVRIDGPLAIVWAPYNFYYKGKFSHCGVDSFELILVDGVWKIQYLIDTRRRNGCQP
jgi:putative lumazine-binding protein